MSRLLNMANETYRQMFLDRAKRQQWTGWDNAELDQVAHLSIDDPFVIAALVAIERFITESK
jgi:Fic family protein